MRKIITSVLSIILICTVFSGCGKSSSKEGFDTSEEITVISREDGSGTRGAFIELFGIEEKNSEGKKIDNTIETADITQSTGVMLTSAADNKYAIGYISLGSLNDTVKALKIDGAEASVENIKNGSYKISRPFNIAAKEDLSEIAKDFVSYILSSDGQTVVEEKGYISASENGAYNGTKPEGKITIAGSSSVTPVMEKLKEAYEKLNPNATIEINQSDSTTGMNSAAEGICDIGMASRKVKDSEIKKGLVSQTIAIDGIAVVVNNNNIIDNLSSQQVKDIYIGISEKWSDIRG